ncbi:hypothetical protein HPP92_005824 [Vanilla planifolia]|uniref:Uncharacterized protein n=1 Tax=Vanilla planifolia TaxID=51239 RepID=A0A835VF89_VANPL|nr:hypothetical protein HPP92_005824 [Vanilla planifolia]
MHQSWMLGEETRRSLRDPKSVITHTRPNTTTMCLLQEQAAATRVRRDHRRLYISRQPVAWRTPNNLPRTYSSPPLLSTRREKSNINLPLGVGSTKNSRTFNDKQHIPVLEQVRSHQQPQYRSRLQQGHANALRELK